MANDPSLSELEQARKMEASTNPALAGIPPKERAFFQTFMPKSTSGPGKMNIAGRARPEEIAKLKPLGWDGKSDLPLNIADLVNMKSDDEVLAELEKAKSLNIDDLETTEYADAPPAIRSDFDDMIARMDKTVAPKIIDSSKKPPMAAKPAPVAKPAPLAQTAPPAVLASNPKVAQKSVADLLSPTKVAAAAIPIPVPQPEPPPAPAQEPATVAQTAAICPRCHLNLKAEYPIKPTAKDIETRIISLASVAQGGDGRFRKSYTIFGNSITLYFRELKTEGNSIYRAEGDQFFSQDPNILHVQQAFSIDRINFRRSCCGLERIVSAGKDLSIPPLDSWVAHFEGNVSKALQELETYVREQCYDTESVLMLAGRCWLEFENLVTAMWADQSFYSGTL